MPAARVAKTDAIKLIGELPARDIILPFELKITATTGTPPRSDASCACAIASHM